MSRNDHFLWEPTFFSRIIIFSIFDEFYVRWLKILHYRDSNESSKSYLESVILNHLKLSFSEIESGIFGGNLEHWIFSLNFCGFEISDILVLIEWF